MASPATIRLQLDSRPESLLCVRATLAGAGEAMSLDRGRLDDLRTAVSEACSNVVLHAYGGQPGTMRVEVQFHPEGVCASVLDQGVGIRSPAAAGERMRVGIPLISALADRAEFISPPEGGTEVRMAFGSISPASMCSGDGSHPAALPGPLSGDVVGFLCPAELLSAVLGRASAAVATRAHFTVDRHSDLQLVADDVAARVRRATPGAAIGFSLAARDRSVQLAIGPLPAGTADAADPLGTPISPLARLTDEVGVEPGPDGDILWAVMVDRRLADRGGSEPVTPPL
jgi:serine/threonine-protein kinase RsbW